MWPGGLSKNGDLTAEICCVGDTLGDTCWPGFIYETQSLQHPGPERSHSHTQTATPDAAIRRCNTSTHEHPGRASGTQARLVLGSWRPGLPRDMLHNARRRGGGSCQARGLRCDGVSHSQYVMRAAPRMQPEDARRGNRGRSSPLRPAPAVPAVHELTKPAAAVSSTQLHPAEPLTSPLGCRPAAAGSFHRGTRAMYRRITCCHRFDCAALGGGCRERQTTVHCTT